MDEDDDVWPKPAPKPKPDDTVSVLMSERMARFFELTVLPLTRGATHLAGPVFFTDPDVPTYIIGIGTPPEET